VLLFLSLSSAKASEVATVFVVVVVDRWCCWEGVKGESGCGCYVFIGEKEGEAVKRDDE
jgi:hypothetical protein